MQQGYYILRTNSNDPVFQQLVAALDDELRIRDGENYVFYAALNKTAFLKYAVVVYENEIPVACGSFRSYTDAVMELKRMYVLPEKRGEGIATIILKYLENWCRELHVVKCILETGRNQPEAIALYKKNGYYSIPPYGKYQGAENSVCFEKILTPYK